MGVVRACGGCKGNVGNVGVVRQCGVVSMWGL